VSATGSPRGSLYLIPNLLGDDVEVDTSLPPLVGATVAKLSHFLVEDEKNARHFIKQLCPAVSIRDLRINRLNEHTKKEELEALAAPLLAGTDIGIISDAGCPAIADPGSEIVRIAHRIGAPVYPLVGPCSMVLALMSSGFNGQRWRFTGYLPIEEQQRRSALASLERDLYQRDETQIFMETPYRNQKLLEDVLAVCRPETGLCVASALSTAAQSIRTRSIKEWAARKEELARAPTIFVLGR
jgi:16S rRNA (cytidine1402-2'-O)-methyltransferase